MVGEARESSDLLGRKNRLEKNGNAVHDAPVESQNPPDGGLRAYMVLLAAFLTNGLVFGQINSYGVIHAFIKTQLEADGVSNADSRAALVGSLTLGMVFFLSPVSGVLTSLLGLRLTAVTGGAVAAAGLVLSSFLTHYVDALMFTYGVMYGLGSSFAYTPSLAILGHYFKKHLGMANGVVTVGSSVFTVFMPPLMEYMLRNHGLEWLFRLLALFALGIALCGLIFKPLSIIPKPPREDNTAKAYIRTIINVEIWKNRKYKFWALSMPIALFGYFVPYVHMKQFMKDLFVGVKDDAYLNLPIQCIAVSSALGRLVFGFLADRPNVDRILLQQISFYVIGTLTIILPFAKVYWLVVVISLGMGLFDGAFIALIGPIAFKLCGSAFAPQAIGCMLGLAALPISVGPYIAGAIYGATKSYTVPLVLAGLSPLVGATLMFAVRFETRSRKRTADAGNGHVSLSSPDLDLYFQWTATENTLKRENYPAPLLMNGKNEQTSL